MAFLNLLINLDALRKSLSTKNVAPAEIKSKRGRGDILFPPQFFPIIEESFEPDVGKGVGK